MTREEKRAEAYRLRKSGKTLQQIAEALGYKTAGSAWSLLNPEKRRESDRRVNAKSHGRKRRWNHANRASCPECGKPMASGSRNPSQRPTRCRVCRELHDRTRVDETAQKIEVWWAAGLSMRQIGDRLGWSKSHLSVEMHRLRGIGYDLPYRYRSMKHPRFPDQVAA